ncbi:uncharacterized protein LOC143893569 [Temnothorax americanus]|uniref:uncharacterized protein LOC143893569 n=1 Tax=Temnothorax americanus TaxID=1964332 RepID=UPI004069413E
MLWAAEQFVREKILILHKVGTQKLQTFHKPRQSYRGSPLKAEQLLHLKNHDRATIIPFNPIEPDTLDARKYNERVRNKCINYSANFGSTMPIMHRFMPANPFLWDHDYTKVSIQDQLLCDLNLLNVNEATIKSIEIRTRGQDGNTQWHEYRRHRITASNFYYCCKTKSDSAKKALALRIINPTFFKSKATDHGKLYESKAIEIFESNCGKKVQPSGLVLHPEHPFIAASPDGILEDGLILEVKCPYTQRHCFINETTITFLYEDDNGFLHLDSTHAYYYQIQGQLFVTKKDTALLIVYTFKEMCVINVPRDEEHITVMVCALVNFYYCYFQPAIFKEYLFKNYAVFSS